MKVLLGVALFLLMLEIPIRAQEVQPVVQNRVASETSFSAQHFAVVSKAGMRTVRSMCGPVAINSENCMKIRMRLRPAKANRFIATKEASC